MSRVAGACLALGQFLSAQPSGLESAQLDINRATRAEVLKLPVDSVLAERIWEYREEYGRLGSIYDLMRGVQGMTSSVLEQLKPLVYVSPGSEDEGRLRQVHRLQREMAAEDGPTAAAVEVWQDLLLTPLNVNRASVDDLFVLENVSLVDAVAVVKHLRMGQRISERRDLANRVEGLSSYGYRNMRNFVAYDDPARFGLGANYRLNYETDPGWERETGSTEFSQALASLEKDSVKYREAGFTEPELAFIRAQLGAGRSFTSALSNRSSVRSRARVRIGDNVRAGGWMVQKLYEPGVVNDYKGFVAAHNLGPLRRLFLGDYRVTLGQGLLLDNTGELMARTHNKPQGIFSDLSENPGFGLRGVAAEMAYSRFGLVGFASRTTRDAILNPDGTANYYIITTPRYPNFKDALGETDLGGSTRLDLSSLIGAPTGTRVAFNALAIAYDRQMNPDAKYLDVPGDAEVLNDPNYTSLFRGERRFFCGADVRTVIENVSFEGEFALQPNAAEDTVRIPRRALLAKTRAQYDYLYVTALFRHYDIGYDNPYNRGYCEQLRFEDTPLEKSYRVIDPSYAALQDFPIPKAEQGFLLETRYQVSRQITFTRAYIDVWRNLAWGVDNVRFQGEVEWRPVFPLRLRFKQKLQSKGLPKPALSTRSFTSESSIRAMASLTNWDFLTGEVREGRVLLTPNLKYGDKASMSGNFLAVQWDHNFSDDFNAALGLAVWLTRDMSQWIFEDSGIDFLDGDGVKWYLGLSDRVSERILLYFKVKHKVSWFPRTGLHNNKGIHFPGSDEPVRDFIHRDDGFGVSLQLDFFW